MAGEIEELLVREVEVGVANLEVCTDEGTTSTQAVVQRTTAHESSTGQERELLLVYDAADVTAVAEALRQASERARADRS
jgi:hypothetical protein